MENPTIENPKQSYELRFSGKGSEYFQILIINWILTALTLGFYYPWARAKKLQYLYNQSSLNDDRFHFSGTGKEMFWGFIKVLAIYFAMLGGYYFIFTYLNSPVLSALFIYAVLLGIIPLALHGALRYRMSRTSYRGIRFGYRGKKSELAVNYFKWIFFTIITFGIYGAWLQMNIRKYTHQNIRFGEVEFSNDADGAEWLILNLKGYILSIFTLGIYSFWWQSEIFAYYIDNMKMVKGDQQINCKSTATGMDFLELLVVNFLIIVFTFGIGLAWVEMRTQKFLFSKIQLDGNINLEDINQTEEEYKDAFGEDAMDFLDIDIA